MTDRDFYHDQMRALQDSFDGRRLADTLQNVIVHDAFSDEDRAAITSAGFFFIATAHDGHVDCSIKAGAPGFVQITGENEIEFPDYDGNSMYRTLGNIMGSPEVGLLFLGFDGQSMKTRISGRASVHRDAETLARHDGAKAVVRVTCLTFPNCPRYAPDLTTGTASPYLPVPGQPSPAPDWKRFEFITPVLPEDDPHKAGIEAEPRDPA